MADSTHARVEWVVETGADAAAARRLLALLRASALNGGRHDPDLFDAAVLGHRRAQRRARAALAAWARSGRGTASGAVQRVA